MLVRRRTYQIALLALCSLLASCATPKDVATPDKAKLTQWFLASAILEPSSTQDDMLLYLSASGYGIYHINLYDTLLDAEVKSMEYVTRFMEDVIQKGYWDDSSNYALYGLMGRWWAWKFLNHPKTIDWMARGGAFAEAYRGTNEFTKALLSCNMRSLFDFSTISNEISRLATTMTLQELVKRDDSIPLAILIMEYIRTSYRCICPIHRSSYPEDEYAYYDILASSWRSNVISPAEASWSPAGHSFRFKGSKHSEFYDSCLGMILLSEIYPESPVYLMSPF